VPLVPGCKSTDQYRADADKEAYDLVTSRRARLGLEGDTFTIEARPDSLRQRILRGETSSSGPLRLPQLLEIASENSRDYQTQREQLFLSALDLTLERWSFSIHSDAELHGGAVGLGDEATVADAGGSLGFTKVLGSGAAVALDIGQNMLRSLTFQDGWHPVTNLGLSITQPILRGFGERIVMEPLTQAERDLVYSVRGYERYRRTYAVDAATRYWRLLQSMNAVENQERNFKSLEDLTVQNLALAEAGRLSVLEVGQARQDELSSRNDLIDTQSRLEGQLDGLKVFLGLPVEFEIELDKGALEELAREAQGGELPEEEALAFAIRNRLDYLTVLDRFDDRKRKVIVAEDQLRSGLTLGATAAVASDDGQMLDYDFSKATWAATLSWQLPIDMLPQRNQYRASLIALQAAARECEESHDTIVAELRDELRTMRTQREGYEIQLRAVQLAERRRESAAMNRDAGRADTRDMLEAERSLLTARNAATSALIDYTLARLAVWRDLEILRVDESGIHADEDAIHQPVQGAGQAGGKPAGG
jgi:outer membrane protein TolC